MAWSIEEGDAFEWLKDFDGDADLIITDPPYESLERHRKVGTTTRLKQSKGSSNQWFEVISNERLPALFEACYRALKPNSHFYMFCDAETMFVAKPMGEAAGFKFWKPIVWDKQRLGMGYHYRARHEFILFFEKGKRRLHDLGVPDVLSFPRVDRGYPTEKPVALSELLIRQSSEPGGLVLDPFCGSGSVGVAALRARMEFMGVDVSPHAVSVATRRMYGEESGREERVP